MLKRIVVVSVVSALGLLGMACSDDAEDACEHINEICSSKQGFTKQDCSKSNEGYDKADDKEKEAYDKIIECVMDTDDCDAATKCALSAASGD